jgi:cytochrome c oxidase accessory protein FixG
MSADPGRSASAPQLVSLYAKQEKIYPRAVSGAFARWRWSMVALTQAVFYGVPWLQWNGRQAVLFDLETPRFYVFGLVLHPQDMIYLAALLVISALALFFFTAVAGRLWCGYACPQTVYTELFLWIERHTEGDRQARMRLDGGPWTWEKLRRKGAKHALWLLLALFTGFSFVGYFLPVRGLAGELAAGGLAAWPLFWVLFYGLATYGNAGWMREQICKYMCPYARFQSTLIDADSLVIAYDQGRGDPRGSRSRKDDPAQLGLGDCVDCTLCVQVCPTGIDIRNGLQNECIGCAACIDVCDGVMDRMGYRRGLIRYGTARGVAQGLSRAQMLRRVWRPRVLVYGVLLLGAVGAMFAGLALRGPVVIDVMRDRGALARIGDEGRIENVYRVQVLNRLERQVSYRVAARGVGGLQAAQAAPWTLGPGEVRTFTTTLSLPHSEVARLTPGAHAIELLLLEPGRADAVVAERSTFIVPR